jgi:GNAT superfamily N-acetyltransferase
LVDICDAIGRVATWETGYSSVGFKSSCIPHVAEEVLHEPRRGIVPKLEFHPLTPERWEDLEQLFGARGACGGCWCMLWRLSRSQFERQKGEQNRTALRALVDSGKVPGILTYADGRPAGWCAVARREEFPALERSRVLKRVDEEPVWSVVCLFVDRVVRRQGVSIGLLRAAIEHVKRSGGKIVEGYPVEPKKDRMPDVFAWTGLASAYRKAGFTECLRRSETRPIMRYEIP